MRGWRSWGYDNYGRTSQSALSVLSLAQLKACHSTGRPLRGPPRAMHILPPYYGTAGCSAESSRKSLKYSPNLPPRPCASRSNYSGIIMLAALLCLPLLWGTSFGARGRLAVAPTCDSATRPRACGADQDKQLAALQSFYALTGGLLWLNSSGWGTDGAGGGRACRLMPQVEAPSLWRECCQPGGLDANQPSPCQAQATAAAGAGAGAAAWDALAVDAASVCCMHGVTCCAVPPSVPACPAAGGGASSNASQVASSSSCQCCGPGASPSNSSCACGSNATTYLVSEIDLSSNGLHGGRFDQALAALAPLNCSLRSLQLQHNDLAGTVDEGISVFQQLTVLRLGTNALGGTIPSGISALQNLTQLDLVPEGLCSGALSGSLVDLTLSNNEFNGTFDVPGCGALVNLDFAYNNITALGNFSGYSSLHIFRYGFNQLHGTIPSSLQDAQSLVSWQGGASNPQMGLGLTGTLPPFISDMTDLALLDLSGNALAGSIPDWLFQNLGALVTLNLQENNLTGTIPPSLGSRSGPLSALRFSQNFLHGSIPESEGFSQLTSSPEYTVELSDNYLHCCGTRWNGSAGLMSYEAVNHSAPRLPSYLKQSSVSQYVLLRRDMQQLLPSQAKTWGAMRCPLLVTSSAVEPPPGGYPDIQDVLNWKIDPRYYMYENCSCETGYQLTAVDNPWVRVVPVMACTPEQPPPWINHNLWLIAVVLVVVFVLLTCGLCYRRNTRPAVLQAIINLKKRVHGEPTNGAVSVVNTDIEGYSDLMQQAPDLMKHALVLHNAAIRKARWTSYGYTVAQEGDSYSLCFHEPVDAVTFCLMTQQLLMRQPWPAGLFPEPSHATFKRRTASRLVSSVVASTQSLFRSTGALSRLSSLFGSWRSAAGSQEAHPYPGGPMASLEMRRLSGEGRAGPSCTLEQRLPSDADSTATQPSEATRTPSEVRLSIDAGHSGTTPESSSSNNQQRLFNGLRVRMGVATGHLQEGTLLRGSAVMDMAKVIADAGAGGQILMDEATFRGIKERLEELAAVDHTGLNVKKLHQWITPWWRFWRPRRPHDHLEALAFDMGRFVFSATISTGSTISASVLTFSCDALGGALGPGSAHGSGEAPKKEEPSLRLFQVVPPALMARAKHFGSKLALKEEWVCVDPPYFAAPGAMEAPLSLAEAELSPTLPPVTMVFCCVDGGRLFAARSRKNARWLNERILCVARSVLCQIPGGYLCRDDVGELKYMLAFPSPAAAIAWCLATQEALMYVDWPAFVTKYERFRLVLGPDKELLFRGPRLKMGVCDGRPKSILPDHMGRADYHGASVNQAARFMDAGAHGGQVVCEEALAVDVLRQFAEAPRLQPTPQPVVLQPAVIARIQAPLLQQQQLQQQQQQQQLAAPPNGGDNSVIGPATRTRHGSLTSLHGGGARLLSVTEDTEGERAAGEPSASPPLSRAPTQVGAPISELSSVRQQQQQQQQQQQRQGTLGPAIASTAALGALSSRAGAAAANPTPPPPGSALLTQRSRSSPPTAPPGVAALLMPAAGSQAGAFSEVAPTAMDSDPPFMASVGGSSASLTTTVAAQTAAPEPHPYLAVPDGEPYVSRVEAHRTGSFRFKGSSEPVSMVQLVLASLARRRFPVDPPKGKGYRILEASGLVASADNVQLPNVSLRYKASSAALPPRAASVCGPLLPHSPSAGILMGTPPPLHIRRPSV